MGLPSPKSQIKEVLVNGLTGGAIECIIKLVLQELQPPVLKDIKAKISFEIAYPDIHK